MIGPDVLARFLSAPGTTDRFGNAWQYHSRSDRHSKVGCWGVAVDLLEHSALMQRHAQDGKIVLGVNHEMTDYSTNRSKKLDLVIARPASPVKPRRQETLMSLIERYDIQLTPAERARLEQLPEIVVAPVGAVMVALEAKACMTAHVKALPRLYDELNSSHLAVHGASSRALAIGYVQINASESFISSDMNKFDLNTHAPNVTIHKQPDAARRVLAKINEIPRRSSNRDTGFDAIGVSVLEVRNDGSPVTLVDNDPAPAPGQPYWYDGMIVRMANEYDSTFADI